MPARKLKILVISAEVAPFAKVGGLADVAGSLPKTLKAMGHDVRVAMPCYRMIELNPSYAVEEFLSDFSVPISPGVTKTAFVKRTSMAGSAEASERNFASAADDVQAALASWTDDIPVYLIGNQLHRPTTELGDEPSNRLPMDTPSTSTGASPIPETGYFQQAVDSTTVYTLKPDPYIFFCRAVLEMLERISPAWRPDVLHCNDWQTGLIPVFARQFYATSPVIKDAATVFTIHNLAYQGNFERELWPETGLPESYYTVDGLEFYGQWTFMKGGLLFSDRVNTVSETYAHEIQTEEYGCGLDGLMRTLAEEGRLSGILNGIDYEEHDPGKDPRIPFHFSATEIAGKSRCKSALQSELGLPISEHQPLIGLISRLADQKGLDLIHAVAEMLLKQAVQFVILGKGDPFYEKFFQELQTAHPDKVRARIAFDIELAQHIYAGSDLFLMPSRFEPCGLGQMFALRYGSIPIVRATGGLADTVHDFDPIAHPHGNGFVFREYTAEALMDTLQRAIQSYRDPSVWRSLVHCALSSDFSWERSAQKYVELFTEAIGHRRPLMS